MKKRKLMSIVLSLALSLSFSTFTVSAETVEQDGISVSYSTDKSQYTASDKINATLTVKNNNAGSVYDVELDEALPEGYALADGSLMYKRISELKSGESQELKTVFVKNVDDNTSSSDSSVTDPNSNDNSSSSQLLAADSNNSTAGKNDANPNTGDTVIVLVYIVIALAACFIIASFRRGKGKHLLSLLLVVSILGTIIPEAEFNVKAVGTDINVTAAVKVDGEDVTLKAIINYSFSKPDTQYDDENVGEIYFEPTSDEHIAISEDGITMYADNELLVVAKAGVSKTEIMNLAAEYDAEVVGYIEQTRDYQWKLKSGDPKIVFEELVENPLLTEVELNYITETITEDYNVGNRWNTNSTGGTELNQGSALKDENNSNSSYNEWWGLDRINAPEAWEFMDENNPIPIKVGLIDSGFNESHNDLSFANNGVFYQNGKNDTDLFSDWISEKVKVNGRDVNKIYQYTHHGSHVAGTMAANGQNEDGIIGVYPYGNNRLYGVSMRGASGDYSKSDSPTKVNASAMEYKVALAELIFRNVKIINFSMGWGAIDQYNSDGSVKTNEGREKSISITSAFLSRLLDSGYDYVIVCSAGNDSNDDPNLSSMVPTSHLESEYNSVFSGITKNEIKDRIIVVGSIDDNNEISNFSDAGNRVDIFAPGRDIWSTWSEYDENGNTIDPYLNATGTSMASPHIAGVAANIWSMNNALTGKQVKHIVCNACLKDENDQPYVPYINPNRQDKWISDCEFAVRVAFNSRENGIIEFVDELKYGSAMGWVYNNTDGSDNYNKDTWKGIPNVRISVSENAEGTGFWRPVVDESGNDIETITDSDGHYELILPEGEYKITATDNTYGTKSISVKIKENEVAYCDWIVFDGSSDPNQGDDRPGDDDNDDNNSDTLNYDDLSKQATLNDYWVVFKEGYRNNQIEMSSFDVNGSFIVTWNKNLICNNQKGKCNQYYYKNGKFEKVREYDILTDYATEIIASNFNIYDKNGNIVFKATSDYNNTDKNSVDSKIFSELPGKFTFSSGAGGWRTYIEINDDGTFTGNYSDLDMGDDDVNYPNGTTHICNFDGKFTNVKKIDDYTYSMKLDYLNTEGTKGDVYYEDGVRYIYADPYGFDNADEFMIYLPGSPLDTLPDEFISWVGLSKDRYDKMPSDLYGIYNVGGKMGFLGKK